MGEDMSELPSSVFIKINPWWKFWLWFKKPVRFPMVLPLTGSAVFEDELVPCYDYYINKVDGPFDDGMIRRYQEALK
jgi:hypothetical protein